MQLTDIWPLQEINQQTLFVILAWIISIQFALLIFNKVIKYVFPRLNSLVSKFKESNSVTLKNIYWIIVLITFILVGLWFANIILNGSVPFKNMELPTRPEPRGGLPFAGIAFLIMILPCFLVLGSGKVRGMSKLRWFVGVLIATWPAYILFLVLNAHGELNRES